MNWKQDITRVLWFVVSIVLLFAGSHHIFTQEIHQRVGIGSAPPALEGLPVAIIGAVEVIAGILLIVWLIRRR